MRFVVLAVGLTFATATLAQTTTAPTASPATPAAVTAAPVAGAPAADATTAAPATATPAKPAVKRAVAKPKRPRMTVDQHFVAANSSHDGKLTKSQATKGKWRIVSRNFTAIDKGKKGYVTLEDIKAYNAAHKPMKHTTAKPASATTPAPTTTKP